MGPAASACELRRAGRRSQAPLASQGVSLEFSYLCCVLVAPCDVCRPILITYEYTSLPPLRRPLLATQNPRRQRLRRPNFSMSALPTVEIPFFSYFSRKWPGVLTFCRCLRLHELNCKFLDSGGGAAWFSRCLRFQKLTWLGGCGLVASMRAGPHNRIILPPRY